MLNVGVLMETSVVFFEAHGGKIWGENKSMGKERPLLSICVWDPYLD